MTFSPLIYWTLSKHFTGVERKHNRQVLWNQDMNLLNQTGNAKMIITK